MTKITEAFEQIENDLAGIEPPAQAPEGVDAESNDTDSEEPDTVLVMRQVLSESTKIVLRSFLQNAIECLDRDEIANGFHLGVVATHLRCLAESIDPNYGGLAFARAYEGTQADPELCDSLHGEHVGEWHLVTIADENLRSKTMLDFIANEGKESV